MASWIWHPPVLYFVLNEHIRGECCRGWGKLAVAYVDSAGRRYIGVTVYVTGDRRDVATQIPLRDTLPGSEISDMGVCARCYGVAISGELFGRVQFTFFCDNVGASIPLNRGFCKTAVFRSTTSCFRAFVAPLNVGVLIEEIPGVVDPEGTSRPQEFPMCERPIFAKRKKCVVLNSILSNFNFRRDSSGPSEYVICRVDGLPPCTAGPWVNAESHFLHRAQCLDSFVYTYGVRPPNTLNFQLGAPTKGGNSGRSFIVNDDRLESYRGSAPRNQFNAS